MACGCLSPPVHIFKNNLNRWRSIANTYCTMHVFFSIEDPQNRALQTPTEKSENWGTGSLILKKTICVLPEIITRCNISGLK